MTDFEQLKQEIERYVRSGMTEKKRAELMAEAQKLGMSGGEFVMLVKNAELELKFQTGVSNTEYPSEIGSGFLTGTQEEEDSASGFINEEASSPQAASAATGTAPFSEIKKLESSGAMSDIYSAIHLGRRKVIIKRIKEPYRGNTEYKNLFYKEFDTGYALDNPNVVRFYGKGEDSEGPYYYMEYVDGRTLADFLKEGHELKTPQITRIVLQIAEALSYMHSKQVFHRDLKPANIMLTYKGDNVKIIDFGLAADDTIVDNLKNAGTPKYAAPELFNNAKTADQRTDIYSLGMIILEIFTGSPDRKRLAQINNQVFREIADRATMASPNDRFHSCDEIISLLTRETSVQATAAAPIPKWLEDRIKEYAADGFISRNERIVLDQEIAKIGADKKIVDAIINDEIEKAVLKKRKEEEERRRNTKVLVAENDTEDSNSMRKVFKTLLLIILCMIVIWGGIKLYKNGFRIPDFGTESVLQEEFKRGDKVYVNCPTELTETVNGKAVMKCAKNQEVEVVEVLYQYVEVKTSGKRGYIDKRYLSHYKH
ncbi:MAG: serine/threonine protein kinase [Bacteroidales bacterium]|nr:serine/threonine protein kinase [Bacteroidales bacterium]